MRQGHEARLVLGGGQVDPALEHAAVPLGELRLKGERGGKGGREGGREGGRSVHAFKWGEGRIGIKLHPISHSLLLKKTGNER